jgi:hypothetical protein
MRHFALILILIVSHYSFAGEPQLEGEVAIPVLVKDSNNNAQAGFISAEQTPQRADALTILRRELQRQEAVAQQKAAKDGVFYSTTKRFPIESMTFFIAIGGVTFNSMWIKSHGDPLQMERHIMSLKDPIAHLSFYSFMQAQGFYMNFHTKGAKFQAMDASTKAQMMRRLSYQGMAIGSLASSIVADLGHSAKMCVDKWIKGKKDEQSLAVCNQAWAQWTVRNKFTQYFPQIISMWAAQAVTEVAERGAATGFAKVTASAWVKKIITKDFLVRAAYKVTAADVVTTFVGGGWVTKSIKFVGKVTRFSGFVAIDHLLSNYTYRPINNIIKPLLFDFDALSINGLWEKADAGKWNMAQIKDANKNIEKFEKEIDNYGTQMQQWRDHLNQDAETDLAGWMEMTKKILNQMDFAYKYYKTFIDTYYETLQVGNLINNKQLAPAAATVITRYPMRTLPFYGVGTGEYKPVGGSLQDFYLVNPNELEKRQKEHVMATANNLKGASAKIKKSFEVDKYNAIIGKLLSGNNMRMAAGLNDINAAIDLYNLEMRQEKAYSMTGVDYISALRTLKSTLGNPQPIIYPFAGFSQAFLAFTPNFQVNSDADFSNWSARQKYKFNKSTDLMFYKMICGQAKGRLQKTTIAGVNFFNPQFDPPSVFKNNAERTEFCDNSQGTSSMYANKPKSQKDLSQFVHHNFNFSIAGDYNNPERKGDAFEKWWVLNAKAPIDQEFKKYDQEFGKAFQAAYNNFFDHRGWYKWVVDGLNQSKYLPKSLKASLEAESNFYLQILTRTMLNDNAKTPLRSTTPFPISETWGDWMMKQSQRVNPVTALAGSQFVDDVIMRFNYLEWSTQNSTQQNFASFYGQVPREIAQLNSLLEQYYTFIQQKNVNFNQYIAHSKKIDTAINDVLVRVGLRRLVAAQASMANDIEDFSAPANSGTENTAKTYEDIPIANPTYKQRMAVSAVKGLRKVESEIRRFIRMRVALAQSLEVDTQELMSDWENVRESSARSNRFNPYGVK